MTHEKPIWIVPKGDLADTGHQRFTDEATEQLCGALGIALPSRPTSRHKALNHWSAALVSLARASRYSTVIQVSLDAGHYGVGNRLPAYSYRFITKLCKSLQAKDLAVVHKGKLGCVTRLYPTDKCRAGHVARLLDEAYPKHLADLVALRKDKGPVEFNHDNHTRTVDAQLRHINAVNAQHALSLDGEPIDPALRAIYNTPPTGRNDWHYGGRLYCIDHERGHQRRPAQDRSRILIDGLPVVEADFTAMHLYLLHGICNHQLPLGEDPYKRLFGDLTTPRVRPWAKAVTQIVLNHTDKTTVLAAFRQAIANDHHHKQAADFLNQGGIPLRQYADRARAAFPDITSHLFTGAGLRLQSIDAEIARRVCLDFADTGDACLPVHDSFLVKASQQDRLVRTMQRIYTQVTGHECPVKSGHF